jgi:mannose-6-phosphate isomerase
MTGPAYPIRFEPIYKERVWGGRRLEGVYGRGLPGEVPIGESWEITDRPEGVSVVANGPWAGRTLRQLLDADAAGVMGVAPLKSGRFPLLVKILDAREVLSLQVHPPASKAAALGGEPKTEMWYFTAVEPGSEILVGLRPGVTREGFGRKLAEGTVADCFHRIPVSVGDAMFLPSGRVHALGGGLMLFEIQENSDTTYRVHDWNRVGLDGRPRPLHVEESMESIDFGDHAPGLVAAGWEGATGWGVGVERRRLVEDALFRVESRRGLAGAEGVEPLDRCRVMGVVRGALMVGGGELGAGVRLGAGDFVLLPARMGEVRVRLEEDAEWLVAEPGGRVVPVPVPGGGR